MRYRTFHSFSEMGLAGRKKTILFELLREVHPITQHLWIVPFSSGSDCRSALLDAERVVNFGAFKMLRSALKPRPIQASHEFMRLLSLLPPLPPQNCMHELVQIYILKLTPTLFPHSPRGFITRRRSPST